MLRRLRNPIAFGNQQDGTVNDSQAFFDSFIDGTYPQARGCHSRNGNHTCGHQK